MSSSNNRVLMYGNSDGVDSKVLKVGCIGGGQLGRMMALEAPRLGIEMFFLDPNGTSCPAAQVVSDSHIVQGSLRDANAIQELCDKSNCDVLTVEIEHVGVEALETLENKGINIQPSSRIIGIIRDKLLQKEYFGTHNVPLPPFVGTKSIASIIDAIKTLGLPIMLKSRKGGYDGRGNVVLKSSNKSDIYEALKKLGIDQPEKEQELDLIAEGWIDFVCEVGIMVVRSSNNTDIATYPPVNAIQQDSICRIVVAPAISISSAVRQKCEQIALDAIDSLGDGASGMFGVELFIAKNTNKGEEEFDILLNEIAPRPHNTGHYTQDACMTSQFENHLRAVCGFPLGSTKMKVREAAMVNILGAKSGTMEDTLKSSNAALKMSNAALHWYGKNQCRSGRKMGHINLVSTSDESELYTNLIELCKLEDIPLSVLPKEVTKDSKNNHPVVGVIMGSQSDLPTMNAAIDICKKFKIPYEVDIVSAHRTPNKLMEYARNAATRGLKVIIAGAGGAAHLPGMVASMTPLPVIGVPVKTSTLSGVDSLYSIVQMPRGIPVATVAIGNAMNAGLLAIRILAASTTDYPNLQKDMIQYQDDLTDTVNGMSAKLQDLGSDAFLEQMDNKNKSVNV